MNHRVPLPSRCGTMSRRDFLLKTGIATASAAALGTGIAHAAIPEDKKISLSGTIPTRKFGKTGHTLPVFGHGGSAMIEEFRKDLSITLPSMEERIAMVRHGYDQGIRYFDTARTYGESEPIMGEALKGVRDDLYLATKVASANPAGVRRSVETSLEQLQTTYLDCVQIHSPVIQRVGFDRAMKIHAELVKLRDEGLFRFIGLSGHGGFDTVYKMISTGGFDQVMLAYGYFRMGYKSILTNTSVELRELCLHKAHELGMGIVAMKVMGGAIFSHNSKNVVPTFDAEALKRLPGAAIRWALRDERICILNIGISMPIDIDLNVETFKTDTTLTDSDRLLLAEYSSKAYENPLVKKLPVT